MWVSETPLLLAAFLQLLGESTLEWSWNKKRQSREIERNGPFIMALKHYNSSQQLIEPKTSFNFKASFSWIFYYNTKNLNWQWENFLFHPKDILYWCNVGTFMGHCDQKAFYDILWYRLRNRLYWRNLQSQCQHKSAISDSHWYKERHLLKYGYMFQVKAPTFLLLSIQGNWENDLPLGA